MPFSHTLGVKQMIVATNKFDDKTVNYQQSRYELETKLLRSYRSNTMPNDLDSFLFRFVLEYLQRKVHNVSVDQSYYTHMSLGL